MSKDYKNRAFRDRPSLLSRKDRFGYTLIYIAIVIFTLFVCMAYLTAKQVIAFWNEGFLACADNVGTYYVIPLCLFILSITIYIDINYRWKDVPLFRKKAKDNNIQHPTAKKEHVKQSEKNKKYYKILIFLGALAICILISLPGLFTRACVDVEGNLHCYNAFNKETSVSSIDEVESLTIKAIPQRHRRRSQSSEFWLTLRYSNGREYIFYNTSFDTVSDDTDSDALNGMLKLKSLVPKEKISVVGSEHLEDVIELYEYEGEHQKLLYELFE